MFSVGLGLGLSKGVGYSAEAIALFSRITTEPSPARKRSINDLVVALVNSGIWAKADALYIMAAADEQSAKLNWVQDAYNLTAVGGPDFAADQGFTNDGAASYLATGLAPSAAVHYQQANAEFGVYSRLGGQSNGVAMGCRTTASTSQSVLTLRNPSDLLVHRINQNAAGTPPANTDAAGLWMLRRTAANTTAVFHDGVSFVTGAESGVTLSSAPFTIGALNQGGTVQAFNNYQLSFAYIGAALTDTQEADLAAALDDYFEQILTDSLVAGTQLMNLDQVSMLGHSFTVQNGSQPYNTIMPQGVSVPLVNFELRPQDYRPGDNAGVERNEFSGTSYSQGLTIWNSFSFYLEPFEQTSAYFIIHQWHSSDSGAGRAPGFAFYMRGPDLAIQTASVDDLESTERARLEDLAVDTWHDVVTRHFVDATNGILQVWIDGVLALDYAGPLGFWDEGSGMYPKFGLYRASEPTTFKGKFANFLWGINDLSAKILTPDPIP